MVKDHRKKEFEMTIGPKCHFIGCKVPGEYFVRVRAIEKKLDGGGSALVGGCTIVCKEHRKLKNASFKVIEGDIWLVP
jgi:hypothetical protein